MTTAAEPGPYCGPVPEDDAVALDRTSPDSFGIGRLFWLTHEAVVGAELETERIVLWNPSAERIFGYDADEAIGMPLDRLVPPSFHDAHHGGILRFRGGAEARLVGGPPVEVPAVAKGGRPLVVSLTLTAVDEADERRHVVAIIRDVTSQKAAEESQRRMFESMQSFVATASHDLRTPLTSVMGFARLLVESGDELPAEEREEFARSILRSGLAASRLVDDLLTLSKIEADVVDVRAERVDVADACRDALAAAEATADVTLPPDAAVRADRDHVQRILVNLLSNAAKYGRPPIGLAAADCGQHVELRVSDDGDGPPEDFLASLFEPFRRANTARRLPGSGLGLSIVKGLAEANGGSVRYEPGEPRGACFVVVLPRFGA